MKRSPTEVALRATILSIALLDNTLQSRGAKRASRRMVTPNPEILMGYRFETVSFLAKMSNFFDPQSGNPYGIIDLKMVHFWLK